MTLEETIRSLVVEVVREEVARALASLPAPANENAPAYLDSAEVSARLSVPVETLRSWRRQGTGPAFVKVGRGVRYLASAIDAWLHATAQTPGR